MKRKNIQAKKIELENESSETEWIKIPETDYEVTKNVLYKGKTYDEIMKLKKPEEELLTLKMIGIICEHPDLLKELKMDSSSTNDDFFFKQPFPQNEKKGYVARFGAYSNYAGLYCDRDSDYSYSYLGVRFVRRKKYCVFGGKHEYLRRQNGRRKKGGGKDREKVQRSHAGSENSGREGVGFDADRRLIREQGIGSKDF